MRPGILDKVLLIHEGRAASKRTETTPQMYTYAANPEEQRKIDQIYQTHKPNNRGCVIGGTALVDNRVQTPLLYAIQIR